MDYQATIEFLYGRLPMFSRIGAAAYKEDIDNTVALCAAIQNPHQQFKSVHIAGTNGKGSVSHMLAAILQTAGYKTGLYTSPHLKDFRERIRINGEMISKNFVVDFTEKIQDQIGRIEPSFFELTVAMAFDYFAKEKVDIAIIETGLGGRLDSTNIITPELSVITNIGMDHMNLLGNTLEKIAFEKAGIIKPGVPVVIGETLAETLPVFQETAINKSAPLLLATEDRKIKKYQWHKEGFSLVVEDLSTKEESSYLLDLGGIYQSKNLLTVLSAVAELRKKGWIIADQHIHSALQQVKVITGLHGRWEILHRSPLLVADVAHNEDGIRQLVQQISVTPHQQAHIIFGAVKDKDIETVLSLFPVNAHYYFTKAQIPRAMPEEELLQAANRHGLKGKAYSTVNTALYAASLKADKNDLILVCGSVFVVGELSIESVRSVWGKEEYKGVIFDALEIAAWSFYR